jgi:hypothetical protein
MIHNLTYSLISHLKTKIPTLTDIVWIYDGVSLTSKVKPFGTIEQMQANTNVIDKERDYFETIYRFQIGVHANSISERSKLQESVKLALLQPNIAYLDTSKPSPPPTIGYFYCDVLSEVPVPVESATDNTNKHKVYFDVEVYVQKRNDGGTNFEQ